MSDAIEELLNEVRLLFNRAVQVGEELHADEPVSMGMRAVLEFLQRNGPAPVPEIARRRMVSRQHVQVLANALEERELVTRAPNPAHRRSALVRLTREGERTITRMRRREARLYDRADVGLRREEVERAARALARVRSALAAAS